MNPIAPFQAEITYRRQRIQQGTTHRRHTRMPWVRHPAETRTADR